MKAAIRVVHFLAKKNIANVLYEDLMNLLSDCGAAEVKEFIEISPQNATYLSDRNVIFICIFT